MFLYCLATNNLGFVIHHLSFYKMVQIANPSIHISLTIVNVKPNQKEDIFEFTYFV